MRAPCQRTALLVTFPLLLFGCTAGEVELYEPEGSGLAQGLTVKLELEAAAAEIGEALGWTGGVPDAEVRVHRIGTEFSWQTALTDSSGVACFPHLLVGSYRVAAYRVLTDLEAEQLGRRRRAFGDGRIIALSGPSTLTLTLAADQRGSLLISELYAVGAYVVETDYNFQHYIEVFNNSDSTIYLDRKILGWAYWMDSDCGPWHCDLTAVFRNDPDGIWTRHLHQFPGSGADYPLPPGGIAVVAMDAVDHTQFHASFPNLSHADMELFGSSDVDNRGVPNMPEVGLAPWVDGHGMKLTVKFTYFVGEPVDVETLPRMWDDLGVGGGQEYVRFPRGAVLDVLATEEDDAYWQQRCPPCAEKVHRDFDRLGGGFIEHGEDLEYSVQRIVLDVTPDGRAILQDTNTSAVDLIRAPYTVGTLPPQN